MAKAAPQRYIGLMSGTSLDGVDGVIAELAPDQPPRLLARGSMAFDSQLKTTMLDLNTPGHNEIHQAAMAAQALAQCYASVVRQMLDDAQLDATQIRAIGAHGQTVRHRPELGYTVQINQPALLAELTGISVVADFRSRDVAAGGQGAPLVPAFHAALFGRQHPQVVLNLGGIANISVLHPDQPLIGFDTGPANVLIDLWVNRHWGLDFDIDGRFAASGTLNPVLLSELLRSDAWLRLPPPKSTGRDHFHAAWLDSRLQAFETQHGALKPEDVQATLTVLTAATVCEHIERYQPDCQQLWVCGGGSHNPVLMRALQERLSCPVASTEAMGVPPQQMEALAFAWLAAQHLQRQPGNAPSVTGANGFRVLGACYPA